jgi:hypothetical protein
MATQPEAFTTRQYPTLDRASKPEGKRTPARPARVLSACEVAECCCPDECLVDHDN